MNVFNAEKPFNRTSLELKQEQLDWTLENLDPAFNRTSLELKHQRMPNSNCCRNTFNRTSLELKRRILRK